MVCNGKKAMACNGKYDTSSLPSTLLKQTSEAKPGPRRLMSFQDRTVPPPIPVVDTSEDYSMSSMSNNSSSTSSSFHRPEPSFLKKDFLQKYSTAHVEANNLFRTRRPPSPEQRRRPPKYRQPQTRITQPTIVWEKTASGTSRPWTRNMVAPTRRQANQHSTSLPTVVYGVSRKPNSVIRESRPRKNRDASKGSLSTRDDEIREAASKKSTRKDSRRRSGRKNDNIVLKEMPKLELALAAKKEFGVPVLGEKLPYKESSRMNYGVKDDTFASDNSIDKAKSLKKEILKSIDAANLKDAVRKSDLRTAKFMKNSESTGSTKSVKDNEEKSKSAIVSAEDNAAFKVTEGPVILEAQQKTSVDSKHSTTTSTGYCTSMETQQSGLSSGNSVESRFKVEHKTIVSSKDDVLEISNIQQKNAELETPQGCDDLKITTKERISMDSTQTGSTMQSLNTSNDSTSKSAEQRFTRIVGVDSQNSREIEVKLVDFESQTLAKPTLLSTIQKPTKCIAFPEDDSTASSKSSMSLTTAPSGELVQTTNNSQRPVDFDTVKAALDIARSSHIRVRGAPARKDSIGKIPVVSSNHTFGLDEQRQESSCGDGDASSAVVSALGLPVVEAWSVSQKQKHQLEVADTSPLTFGMTKDKLKNFRSSKALLQADQSIEDLLEKVIQKLDCEPTIRNVDC